MEMLQFSSKGAAVNYLIDRFSDREIDSVRVAYCDDDQEIRAYEKKAADAKGSTLFDMYVRISGFKAMIGCNYDLPKE